MKRFILLVAIMSCLSGCDKSHPNKNNDTYREQLFGGYFTVLENWERQKYVVYANDTGVKYFVFHSGTGSCMTPLYNADGSLQVYEGE